MSLTLSLNPLVIPVGIAIGILVAAPVGPVNILCIQRSISRGMWGGIAAGLGAVLGDGLIALAAAMGVSAISGLVAHYRAVIQMIGGLVLVAFGARLYVTAPRLQSQDNEINGREASIATYGLDVLRAFLFTITNPGAVLGLFAIFGGISTFVEVRGPVEALLMVAAVMVGSLLWWVALASFVGRFRSRITEPRLALINHAAGLMLVAMGAILVGEIALKQAGILP
ncbi:MAG: LysE family transporter [Hyphomicrobiaceae bacterium]|nr:LysE family transporter [Hyphomicrobiaceae bacterium]